jgi:hypothetical protein
VRDEGDQLLRPDGAAQRTSTGLTNMCGVSVSSSSCATFLLTSCQVRENGGERRGKSTTTTQRRSSTNKYGTDRHVLSLCKFEQLRNFSFNILPNCENGGPTSCQVRRDGGERRGRPTTTSRQRSSKNEYGTDRHVWSLISSSSCATFFFRHLAKFVGRVVSDGGDLLLRPDDAAQ